MDIKMDFPDELIPIIHSKERFVVLHGGRSSGKSHAIARILILKALKEKCLILCTRHIQKSIAASSYSLLVKIINEYKLNPYFTIVENEIRCNRTGSKFIFMGLWSNLDNVRSLEGLNYIWCEEAAAIVPEAWRILIPTLRAEGSQFYITFNPESVDDEVYKMFILNQRSDALVKKINYNQNPFLTDTIRKEIEYMRIKDPDLFDWIYEGNIRATTEITILHNVVIHDFVIDESRQMFYGFDAGYEDPNALVKCYIYDHELYVCNEFYKNRLDPEELKQEFLKIPWIQGKYIVADSSRPEIIKMLNSTGRFQVAGAKKNIGQPQKLGNYKFSFAMYLKQFKNIHIHASNCPNAAREFQGWSWSTDKNENILDIVQDHMDHSVDATIYALENSARAWYATNHKR